MTLQKRSQPWLYHNYWYQQNLSQFIHKVFIWSPTITLLTLEHSNLFYEFYKRDHKHPGYSMEMKEVTCDISRLYTTVWHFDLITQWDMYMYVYQYVYQYVHTPS